MKCSSCEKGNKPTEEPCEKCIALKKALKTIAKYAKQLEKKNQ